MREHLDDCVHCGFCLPSCPTYAIGGEEMDSPRGRILLMDLVDRGELVLTDTVVGHWDACLGCMACVTSCPSGVRYDLLISEQRQIVEATHSRSTVDRWRRRALFHALPHAGRLRPLAYAVAAYRATHLPRPRLTPPVTFSALRQRTAERTPPRGERRLTVALALGCVGRTFYPDVNAATARVLAACGCEVLAPPDQGCCGALELHAGRAAGVARRATLLDRLAATGADLIVVNAAGCGSSLKEADHPAAERVRDVLELVAELGPPTGLQALPLRVAYHDACHLAHAQGIRAAPRECLAAIPDLELVEIGDDLCCGSAGTYNLLRRDTAAELGRRKAAAVRAVAPDVLAAANPGCLLQIAGYLDVPTAHPIQLLDASLAGRPWR